MLDAEIRKVQILLVNDRRDPWVDLDHMLADELDVEEVVEAKLTHDRLRGLHQLRIVESLEIHRKAGAHRLPRLRMAEDYATAFRDPVHRPLLAGRDLHDEQLH